MSVPNIRACIDIEPTGIDILSMGVQHIAAVIYTTLSIEIISVSVQSITTGITILFINNSEFFLFNLVFNKHCSLILLILDYMYGLPLGCNLSPIGIGENCYGLN